MKKTTPIIFLSIACLALLTKTIGTFPLCGGTFMQNWVGTGACTDSQQKFLGFAHSFMDGRESFAALLLLFFLVILLFIWRKLGANTK